MDANFKFHSVGHGLFYSGVINALDVNVEPFAFVYDCGGGDAKGRFDELWRRLQGARPAIPLKLLVVSHFHKDHISGIPNLLKTAKPRFVVIPYLPLAERVACVATLLGDFNSDSEQDDLVALVKFVLMPEAYCKELGCKLYLINPNIQGEGLPENHDEFSIGFGNNELKFPGESPQTVGDRARVIRNGAIGFFAGWGFHFFMPKRSAMHEEITRWLDKKGMNEEWLKGYAINDELFAEIKAEFGKLDLKGNGSNLVCVHGPVHNKRNACVCVLTGDKTAYSSRLCVRRRGWHAECVMPACLSVRQMLTGDAEFNEVSNFSNWMSDNECNQVALFQVPHHGSPHNREDWFERRLPNCVAWVVPHDFSARDRKNVFKINGTFGEWVYYVKRGLDVCLTSLR